MGRGCGREQGRAGLPPGRIERGGAREVPDPEGVATASSSDEAIDNLKVDSSAGNIFLRTLDNTGKVM